jgi:hypothetical protein
MAFNSNVAKSLSGKLRHSQMKRKLRGSKPTEMFGRMKPVVAGTPKPARPPRPTGMIDGTPMVRSKRKPIGGVNQKVAGSGRKPVGGVNQKTTVDPAKMAAELARKAKDPAKRKRKKPTDMTSALKGGGVSKPKKKKKPTDLTSALKGGGGSSKPKKKKPSDTYKRIKPVITKAKKKKKPVYKKF